MADDERGFTDAMWDKIAELGWPGLLVPESNGGLGLGLVDMAVVLEEMGRLPFPGPFFSSAVFATLAARRLEEPDLLAQLATGAIRGTVALEELGHDDPVPQLSREPVELAGDELVAPVQLTLTRRHLGAQLVAGQGQDRVDRAGELSLPICPQALHGGGQRPLHRFRRVHRRRAGRGRRGARVRRQAPVRARVTSMTANPTTAAIDNSSPTSNTATMAPHPTDGG